MAGLPELLGAAMGRQMQQQQAQPQTPAQPQAQAMGQQAGLSSYGSMSMGADWQRLYDELAPEAAPITQPTETRQLQVQQPTQSFKIETPQQQQQKDEGSQWGTMAMSALAMMSDPQTKVIHDRLTNQFAQAAQPIVYEYNQEAQQRYGMPPGMRMGVDARRIADEGGPMGREVTAETEDGLKVLKPDEGVGTAMATAAQAVMTNQQQEMQMKRMMDALDERFFEMEMRNRLRSTKV